MRRFVSTLPELKEDGLARNHEVDLAAQTVTDPNGDVHRFEIDAFAKHCLLNGIDELDYTLAQKDKIAAFERAHAAEQDWTMPAENRTKASLGYRTRAS